MDDLEQWISRLGEDANFGADAVSRLENRLAFERPPIQQARRRTFAASLVFAGVAGFVGAVAGALIEVQQTPDTSVLLPASQAGTIAAMFRSQS